MTLSLVFGSVNPAPPVPEESNNHTDKAVSVVGASAAAQALESSNSDRVSRLVDMGMFDAQRGRAGVGHRAMME